MKKLEIDINNLRERINNALEESGWTPALAPFINGLSFDIILNSLVTCTRMVKGLRQSLKTYLMHSKSVHTKKLKLLL